MRPFFAAICCHPLHHLDPGEVHNFYTVEGLMLLEKWRVDVDEGNILRV
jgi:hypothetical protein